MKADVLPSERLASPHTPGPVPRLHSRGYVEDHCPEATDLLPLVESGSWLDLDQQVAALTSPGGALFTRLQQYHPFSHTEFIIAIRDALDPDQEDGIWHDDGSRFLAFTLSLTPEIDRLEGGYLGLRRKGSAAGVMLPTPNFGHLYVYLTGWYGYEHRIHRVTSGRRIIIAGWCSSPQLP
jgi:hypothetical protein